MAGNACDSQQPANMTKAKTKRTAKRTSHCLHGMVRCVIQDQGAAIINHGWIQSLGETVVAIGVDMRSKRCIIGASGSDGEVPLIVIDTNSESLHLKKGNEGELTVVTFPDFKGWSVWCADIARYTVAVCLIKREASNADLRQDAGSAASNVK